MKKTHILFVIGVVMKGLAGVFELVGAFILFSTGELSKLVVFFTEHELGEDPTDFLANRVREFLPYFSVSTQLFAAWYFLIHSIINLVLAVNLLRKRLWAYPAAMGMHGVFIFYQLYRFTYTHSQTLLVVSVLDVLVLWLVYREYQFLKTKTEQGSRA